MSENMTKGELSSLDSGTQSLSTSVPVVTRTGLIVAMTARRARGDCRSPADGDMAALRCAGDDRPSFADDAPAVRLDHPPSKRRKQYATVHFTVDDGGCCIPLSLSP